MINVFFPPGCYGTYFTQCLYNYTSLRNTPFEKFEFIYNGSSHQYRDNLHARSVITHGHIDTLRPDLGAQIVTIIPCALHNLDYYNNQFFKQQHGQLIQYILTQLSLDDIRHKLATHWNYNGNFDENMPRWIMREWCSFWIADVLSVSYDAAKYNKLNSTVQLSTQDIFENYTATLATVASAVGLKITADWSVIIATHNEFLAAQKFHNIQNRCQQFVHDLLAGNNSNISVHSIFDEAYIQHLLRQHNLEIMCNGLDIFPRTTPHLRTVTYETSNNSN